MPEVIKLLSSTAIHPAPAKHRVLEQPGVEPPSDDLFDVSSDDLESSSLTDDLDFLSAQPNKKRPSSPLKP
jgi:hypothetical protein